MSSVTCFSDVNSKLQKLDPDAFAAMALVGQCKLMNVQSGGGFPHFGDSVSVSGDRCEISVIVEVADAFLLRPSSWAAKSPSWIISILSPPSSNPGYHPMLK